MMNPNQILDNSNDGEITSNVPVFVISGGVGSSGEQIVRTVLAQFPHSDVSIQVFPKVNTKKRVKQILNDAHNTGAIVAHTFVDPGLRWIVKKYSKQVKVVTVDLIGPLMENLAIKLKQEPLGKPGLYRQLFKSYFDRIDAMDYALDHDDGKNQKGWASAEIILLGASRVGKTPISLYLSVLGWKVANIPLVAGIKPREILFDLDQRRLVGLTIAPSDLIEHRQHRQRLLGVINIDTDYIDPVKVFEELEEIEKFYRRNRIPIVNVTGKPIESCADEVIKLVRKKLKRARK
jgi:regulator of PEP synthase PpsR (kinase-PPPase family)